MWVQIEFRETTHSTISVKKRKRESICVVILSVRAESLHQKRKSIVIIFSYFNHRDYFKSAVEKKKNKRNDKFTLKDKLYNFFSLSMCR